VVKSEKVAHASPWHQDYVYWFGTPKVSAWVALDDATLENGCLRVVPGSHSWGLLPHEKFNERVGFDNRVPAERVDNLCRRFRASVVDVPLPAGHAIIFSDLLLHSSNPNKTGADRYSLIPTFRDSRRKDTSTVWQCGAKLCESVQAFALDGPQREGHEEGARRPPTTVSRSSL
jgi:ectoine hydroxylase-related dioxygenase (phytanoyl-CoA dioxygenase family)